VGEEREEQRGPEARGPRLILFYFILFYFYKNRGKFIGIFIGG
jgi:hypothetical protein